MLRTSTSNAYSARASTTGQRRQPEHRVQRGDQRQRRDGVEHRGAGKDRPAGERDASREQCQRERDDQGQDHRGDRDADVLLERGPQLVGMMGHPGPGEPGVGRAGHGVVEVRPHERHRTQPGPGGREGPRVDATGEPMIRLESVGKRYPDGTVAVHELSLDVAPRRGLRAGRAVRLRQDHDDADDQPADRADVRPDLPRRRGRHQRRPGRAAPPHRLRHPAGRSVPAPDRRGERRDRAGPARLVPGPPQGPRRRAARPGRARPGHVRQALPAASCPAVSASASASPARSPPTRRCC